MRILLIDNDGKPKGDYALPKLTTWKQTMLELNLMRLADKFGWKEKKDEQE